MRSEITKRNILLVALSLLIFLIVSILMFSYYNRKNLEINLVNITDILVNQLEDINTDEELNQIINDYTKHQNWLRISVYDTYGRIIMDSHTDNNMLILDDIQMKKILAVNPKPYISYSTIFNDKMLYYGLVLNEDIILRTSIPLTDNSALLLSGIFFMSILIVFVILLSTVYTKNTTDKVMSAFSLTIENLKDINEGIYNPIYAVHKYPEVEEVLREINEVNEKISESFNEVIKERDKLDFILDNMNQGILIVDLNKNIIILNKKMKTTFNIVDTDSTNQLEEIFKIQEINEIINQTIKTNTPLYLDYYNPIDDKIYLFSTSTINKEWLTDEANFKGVVLIFSDVTEERKNSQIKDEFIANVSHELKTPITSISGFSELITSGLIEDQDLINDYINRILKETKKMKDIIDNLLSLSLLESEKSDEKTVKVNLKDIIDDVLESYAVLIKKSNLIVNLDASDAYIYANPQLIYHLVSNLIDNAIKYNVDGGNINIKVIDNTHNIRLVIEDSGIGMDKKNLDRIFARFYRIDNSRSSLTGGSGLGLSIVKKICTIYNASIDVESKINEGTKVTITFIKE